MNTTSYKAFVSAIIISLAVGTMSAQTAIAVPPNRYAIQDDVALGRQAASQVRRELPILKDDRVDDYVDDIGRRLTGALPPRYRHAQFRYTFDVVNVRDLNAFALPGGPMFVNRGLIQAAKNEAELAGVMAHELSHVVLRHGTAQATKGQKFQLGAIAGQILGAIVGGTAGNIIAQGSNMGLSTYFLKYTREYERQADLLGAQIMARAGYDPRQMANMFRTLQREGGRGGPEWLSSHPNPSNRSQAITREAQLLKGGRSTGSTAEFTSIQSRLRRMPAAPSSQQVARAQR